ncbi:MAG: shikimate dehydrogenase [Cellulosilyticaceae bacterium]
MKSVISSITGKERVCGVIGDPIGHSLSPMIHNTIATHLGHPMHYMPFGVTKENLEHAIKGAHALGIRGLNVTMPHKQALWEYVTGTDEWAQKVGAINTLVYEKHGYLGCNTDAYGVQKALEGMGCDYTGQNVAIIGSGGAAYAAALCVAERAKALHIINRTSEKAQQLKEHLMQYTEMPIYVYGLEETVSEQMHLVIQTTGVGMGTLKGQMPPQAEVLLEHAQYAMDMVYSPWETVFLKSASQKGLTVSNGFGMLYYQAVKAYELMNDCLLDEGTVEYIKQEIESSVECDMCKKDLP